MCRDVDEEHGEAEQAAADAGAHPVDPRVAAGECKDEQCDGEDATRGRGESVHVSTWVGRNVH